MRIIFCRYSFESKTVYGGEYSNRIAVGNALYFVSIMLRVKQNRFSSGQLSIRPHYLARYERAWDLIICSNAIRIQVCTSNTISYASRAFIHTRVGTFHVYYTAYLNYRSNCHHKHTRITNRYT